MGKDMNELNNIITYNYRFSFDNGLEKQFKVVLDRKSLDLIQKTRKVSYPQWAALPFCKCPNCPFQEDRQAFCPVAVSLVDVVDFFQAATSYEEVDVLIEHKARRYVKRTTLQQGISSLIGIYMVTSGCSVMEKLKPMVRYHLPFATMDETQYRVMSMYLLAQYFLYRRGKEADWELKNLVRIYDDIQIVNKSFFQRLAHTKINDAALNALVKLDMFAKHISDSITADVLDEMECLFHAYFE